VDGVVKFFLQRSDVDIEELRTRYLTGMVSMFVSLAGTNFIDRVLAPAGTGGETMDDSLDCNREGRCGAALMAAAYLGRIDDMEALLVWCIGNTADLEKLLLRGLLLDTATTGTWLYAFKTPVSDCLTMKHLS
jgi:hypothetical protein